MFAPSTGPQAAATPAHGVVPNAAAQRWLHALCIGIVAVYAIFFLTCAGRVGPVDQDQFLVFHELQYWNAMLFGLAKQWTPVMCSGLSLAGEPQVPFLSLSMALGYVLGPFWGIKVATVAYFSTGWIGAYLYAGLWMRLRLQRALAAALFIGNGFFFCRLGAGHADFMPFLILPLVLWMLHQSILWQTQAYDASGILRLLGAVLCMGGMLSLAVDGSPVTIIHLLFWLGVYAMVLARCIRAWTPLVVLVCALAIASLLDAGYLWPMLEAQASFPRLTADRFTSALSLLWFALVPMRGKLLPANGLGHELSVFIGPFIAWAIWRHRKWINAHFPSAMKSPLLVVTIVTIVMGMGSLTVLHVPRSLSLFDTLRPLPGFRSIGVTGRYWGFLALPLSLLGAAALWRFASEPRSRLRLSLWMGATMFLQLGFQAETIFGQWLGTSPYHPVPWQGRFQRGPETVSYVSTAGRGLQSEFIAPTRGVVDCYNMDDFTHAEISPGAQLVREGLSDGRSHTNSWGASARFATWNQIRLHADHTVMRRASPAPTRIQWILNQAYHDSWRLPGCTIERGARGNLIADCPTARLQDNPPTLTFFDPLSARGASVSVMAWRLWGCTLAASLLALWALRGVVRRSASADALPS